MIDKIKIALFGFLSGLRINIVGQLFGSELISLIFFPLKNIIKLINISPLRRIAKLYIYFLISLIVSDVFVNFNSPEDYLRGWATVIFSFIQIVFLVNAFLKDNKNYVVYLLFSAISFFLFRPEMEGSFVLEGNDFKVYFMSGINLLVLLFAYRLGNKNILWVTFIFLSYSLFCMIADARSNGITYFISAILLFLKARNIRFTLDKTLILGIFVLGLSYIMYIIYVNNVISGKIGGLNAQQILGLENPYNPFELLLEGRKESFFPIYVIMDYPLFGLGSWAKDPTGEYIRLYNYMTDTINRDESLIPAHSIFFASWLWGGLFGVISITLIYFKIFSMAYKLYAGRFSLALIIILPLLIDQMWHFMFSPIGHMRLTSPFFFALTIVEFYKLKKNEFKPFI